MTTDGQFVGPGEPLVLVGTRAEPQVIAYVSPEIAPRLSVGSEATIRFPDGTKAQASVAEQPMLTRRMPADLVDQFGVRPMTVVLHLQAAKEWPDKPAHSRFACHGAVSLPSGSRGDERVMHATVDTVVRLPELHGSTRIIASFNPRRECWLGSTRPPRRGHSDRGSIQHSRHRRCLVRP